MKKKKVIGLLILAVLLTVAAFVLSGYGYIIFIEKEMPQLDIGRFLGSLLTNRLHQKIFLAMMLMGLAGGIVIALQGYTNEYKSDLRQVTDTITTPERMGQLQHGSARFMTEKEKEKEFCSAVLPQNLHDDIKLSKGGVIIGYDKHKRTGKEKVFFVDDDVHSMILGATRSGKTRGFILQSIAFTALSGESMIISDPKGEILDYTEPYLREMGYEVLTLNFRQPKKSHRYNFLQPIIDAVNEGDMPKAIDRTWDLVTTIVPETKEKIWSEGEKSLMAGAILSVVIDNKEHPEHQHLSTVYSFINKMSTYDPAIEEIYLKKYIKNLRDEHPAKEVFGIALNTPHRQRASFIAGALTTLNLFTNPNIRDMTQKSDYALKETGNKKRALFIILPDEKNTFNTLASIFVEQQYTALVEQADKRGGRLKNRCNFLLDEFGNFTKIPNFLNFLTVGGGRGIRFNLVIQSFEQLNDKYGKEVAGGIKGNCHVWVYLASSDKETQQEISQRLGKYTVASFGKSSGKSGMKGNYTASQSQNLTARELLTLDEVGRIARPYVLVLYQGKYPAMVKIPDISKWRFNLWLGMGDEEYNRKLRMTRQMQRSERSERTFIPCGTWDTFYQSTPAWEMPPIEGLFVNDEIDL